MYTCKCDARCLAFIQKDEVSSVSSHLFPDAWTSCLASYSPVHKFDQYLDPKILSGIVNHLKNTVTPKCGQNYEIWGCESFFQIVVLLIHLLVQVDVLLLVISDLLQNLLQQLLWPSHPLFPKVCFKSLDLFGVDQGALEEREDKYSIYHKTKIQNWYWKF